MGRAAEACGSGEGGNTLRCDRDLILRRRETDLSSALSNSGGVAKW
jgi:hypothetical protein